MKSIRGEFTRYLVIGVVNTVISYLVFALLQTFIPYQIAYTITFVAGIFWSYWLNSVFVFSSRMTVKQAVRYPIVYLVQYVTGIVLLALLVEVLGIMPVLASPPVIVAVIPITFALSRRIIKG